jgi:hypothetical protein
VTDVLVAGGVGAVAALGCAVWALVERVGRVRAEAMAQSNLEAGKRFLAEVQHAENELATVRAQLADEMARAHRAAGVFIGDLEACRKNVERVIQDRAAVDPIGAAAVAGGYLDGVLARLRRATGPDPDATSPGKLSPLRTAAAAGARDRESGR